MSWTQQRWEILWQAIKDVALTGTGTVLILTQVWSRTPSDILLVTGLALTVPSVAGHARVLLGSGNSGRGESSSPSTPPSGSSSSGSSSEAADEEP